MVHLFYLTAFNNSIDLLANVASDAWLRLKEHGIDFYGNGLHWSQAWTLLTNDEKAKLVEYMYHQ
jgi:hypothetical protein